MESNAREIPSYTSEEYFKLTENREERTELLDGEIVAMASPSIRHQDIVGGIYAELRQFVKQNRGSCRPFAAPTDVKLDEFNVVVPDVFIACDPSKFDSQCYNGAPDFVAEVVSSNRSDDFIRKLYLYRISGVREYWIIDPLKECVHVYFFEEDTYPEVYDFHTPIPVHIWGGKLSITISDLEMM
ncbi:MAG: Uma2 family endonuclease [Oscillospiraceae bacterium]|nr:Uma2 family endonuclease [Oscillospiraceae bacterium]